MLTLFKSLFGDTPSNGGRTVAPPRIHVPARHGKFYGTDKIALVGFHDYAFPIAMPAEPFAAWLHERVNKLPSKVGGSFTNVADALRKSLDILAKAPPGAMKRIWLLSDGHPNKETEEIMPLANKARDAWVNVNTIGFGDPNGYDENLLRTISSQTHNGKFIPVQSLRELSAALITNAPAGNKVQRHRHRAEYTVLAVDCSGSMSSPMEGRTRIEVVREAVFHLLNWKQKNFA